MGILPMEKNIRRIELILTALSGALLLFFLSWHLQLGLHRYFDVDEYAHLHWTSHLLMGKKPYIDFLTFFPPGFWWFLSPAFIGGWGTVTPFIHARILMFAVFFMMCLVSGLIFWELRHSWLAVTAAVLLAFLPLPFDKYLEIRPDSLAALFVLLGMYFQIRWINKENIKDQSSNDKSSSKIQSLYFLSGFFYSGSLITLTKMLPNVAVGAGVAILWAIGPHYPVHSFGAIREIWKRVKFFIFGFAVPGVVFLIWLVSLGDLPKSVYSLTTLTIESNRISQWFIMMPNLFFYPNEIYFGVGGWSRPLITNIVLWMVAIFVGAVRFVAPFLAGGKKQALPEFLVAAQFYVQIIFFVAFAPLKHAQYLIPIGVFVAWYVADILQVLWNLVRIKPVLAGMGAGMFILLYLFLFDTFKLTNAIKFRWPNEQVQAEIAEVYRKIPPNEPVLDLDGRMLYNPDPYYACCIPFGQFMGFLSRPLPDLPSVLATANVRYINQGELERVKTLPWQWQEPIFKIYSAGDVKWLLEKK